MSFLTGDAADGLAQIVAANEAVKILAAGSPSQADLDAYQQQIGGVAGILKSQLAVNLGIAQACPGIGCERPPSDSAAQAGHTPQ